MNHICGTLTLGMEWWWAWIESINCQYQSWNYDYCGGKADFVAPGNQKSQSERQDSPMAKCIRGIRLPGNSALVCIPVEKFEREDLEDKLHN